MLKLVQGAQRDVPRDRLSVASAHLEAAILHINNEAQRHVPLSGEEGNRTLNQLRQVVCALADILSALRLETPPSPAEVPDTTAGDGNALAVRATRA